MKAHPVSTSRKYIPFKVMVSDVNLHPYIEGDARDEAERGAAAAAARRAARILRENCVALLGVDGKAALPPWLSNVQRGGAVQLDPRLKVH